MYVDKFDVDILHWTMNVIKFSIILCFLDNIKFWTILSSHRTSNLILMRQSQLRVEETEPIKREVEPTSVLAPVPPVAVVVVTISKWREAK